MNFDIWTLIRRFLYEVNEVLSKNGGILPLSKSTVYKLAREGKIPSTNLGRRVFILGSFIESLKRQGGSAVSA